MTAEEYGSGFRSDTSGPCISAVITAERDDYNLWDLPFLFDELSVLFRDGRRVPLDQELRIALPLSRFDTSWSSDSEPSLTASKTVKPVSSQQRTA
jgi:hypothetical protein